MKKYIIESKKRMDNNKKEYQIYNTFIFIKDQFKDSIDLEYVIERLKERLPYSIFNNVDGIYAGQFDFLKEKDISALYQDGTIFISNEQQNEEDLIADLFHEIGHLLEEKYFNEIYKESRIKSEFLNKRKQIYNILKTYKQLPKQKNLSRKFKKIEYDAGFDQLLYKQIGYPVLQSLSCDVFITPYAITSLREYWATGFEYFCDRDRNLLKKISPKLYAKIEEIFEKEGS